MNIFSQQLKLVNKAFSAKQLAEFMMFVVLFIFLLFGFLFERKPGGGDSGIFIKIAQGGFNMFFNNEINQYRFTRTFPSLLIGTALRVFHFSLTPENIRNAFNLLNAVAIFIALHFWLTIFDFFKFRLTTIVIWFTGMFVNFAILKFSMFNPILTDTTAFMIGTILIYYFFINSKIKLLIFTFIGAFTFPPLIVQGLLLYIFPYERNNTIEFNEKKLVLPILSVTIYLLGICIVFFFLPEGLLQKIINRIPAGINYSLLILSIPAICYYILKTSGNLLSLDYYKAIFIKYIVIGSFWLRTMVALSIIVLVKVLTFKFASQEIGVNPYGFLTTVLISPLQNPFLFLLSHILYYGPVVILIIFFWNQVSRFCNSIGIAFNLLLLFCIFLSFQSESRMLITLLPMIILAFTHHINTFKIKQQHLIIFILLSFIFSRFWFKIWETGMQGNYLEFPMQRYFMNQGPWMSNTMYYVQLAIILLCAIPLYLFVKRSRLNSE